MKYPYFRKEYLPIQKIDWRVKLIMDNVISLRKFKVRKLQKIAKKKEIRDSTFIDLLQTYLTNFKDVRKQYIFRGMGNS